MASWNHEELLHRLRALSRQPVDPGVAARHASLMASVPAAAPPRRLRPPVAAAFLAGTVLGGAGLAGAVTGTLPEPAQDVAHDVLAKVNVRVPQGDKGKSERRGTPRFTAGCTYPDGRPFTGNHGQYVKAHPDDPATVDVDEREVAARSDCGKPQKAVENKARGGPDDEPGEQEGGKPDKRPKATDGKTPGQPPGRQPQGTGRSQPRPSEAPSPAGSSATTEDPGRGGGKPRAGE